jgi:hypothetical protein
MHRRILSLKRRRLANNGFGRRRQRGNTGGRDGGNTGGRGGGRGGASFGLGGQRRGRRQGGLSVSELQLDATEARRQGAKATSLSHGCPLPCVYSLSLPFLLVLFLSLSPPPSHHISVSQLQLDAATTGSHHARNAPSLSVCSLSSSSPPSLLSSSLCFSNRTPPLAALLPVSPTSQDFVPPTCLALLHPARAPLHVRRWKSCSSDPAPIRLR